MSRFDLIYLVLDRQNDTQDRRLANHIVSLYSKANGFEDDDDYHGQRTNTNIIDKKFFAQYISYARQYIKPIFNEQVGEVIV
mmetsp:Transcript_41450/g.29879  ORF Transcript_41450/g.29879 Transcript_41450/m.29879 type:complete len:82 (+) Transcript_41450:1905-2150(+)